MTVVHTYFSIIVDTQRGCHTLKLHTQTYRAPRPAAGEELKVRTRHRARHEGQSVGHNSYEFKLTSCLSALYFPGCGDE